MVNSRLTLKSEKIHTPTDGVKKLFQVIYREQNKKENGSDIPKIKVSELISKMSFYYEKIRNAIDYKDEHLLRKGAVERILKRHIVIEGAIQIKDLNSRDISKNLIVELIRGGYLLNDSIPETKIGEIDLVIQKYLKLRMYFSAKKNIGMNEKHEYSNWIISMCACDIEEKLGRNVIDSTVIDYMYNILDNNIVLPKDSEYNDDRGIQIYIGIHRNLLKFDNEMLGFILLKYFNADWSNATDELIKKVAEDIIPLRVAIDNQTEHPFRKQLSRIIARYTVFFRILLDVIEDDPTGVYDCFKKDPKAFPRQIRKMCNTRYTLLTRKKWRAALRSIIYILITKSLFVIALEYPIVKYLSNDVNNMSIFINITFPAFLMLLLMLFTKIPGDDNSLKIIEGINEITFIEHEKKDAFKLKNPTKRRGFINGVFGVLYFITFLLSFGLVIWFLDKLNFNWISMIIFLFFLAFISFFSIRIRINTRELVVIKQKESIIGLFVDFFYVPIILVGKWLSEKFSKLNVFVFVLDFIIEAPFKIFVDIAEEWTKYVKERKDEIV
jgi:hypothetical protein